jgi:hypothetical protein
MDAGNSIPVVTAGTAFVPGTEVHPALRRVTTRIIAMQMTDGDNLMMEILPLKNI